MPIAEVNTTYSVATKFLPLTYEHKDIPAHMDLMPLSLADLEHSREVASILHKYGLTFPPLACMTIGIAKFIKAMHDRGLLHGDLKPANLLLDRINCVIGRSGVNSSSTLDVPIGRVGDFGFVLAMGDATWGTRGTQGWCLSNILGCPRDAAEFVFPACIECDLVPLGQLLLYLLLGKTSFTALLTNQLRGKPGALHTAADLLHTLQHLLERSGLFWRPCTPTQIAVSRRLLQLAVRLLQAPSMGRDDGGVVFLPHTADGSGEDMRGDLQAALEDLEPLLEAMAKDGFDAAVVAECHKHLQAAGGSRKLPGERHVPVCFMRILCAFDIMHGASETVLRYRGAPK